MHLTVTAHLLYCGEAYGIASGMANAESENKVNFRLFIYIFQSINFPFVFWHFFLALSPFSLRRVDNIASFPLMTFAQRNSSESPASDP